MEMDYGSGSIYMGTGTLIGENYVITAAHNLYDRRSGSIPQKITFFPGLRHKKIYAASQADRIIYHPRYMDTNNKTFKDVDIGIIRLTEPLGKKIGSLGVKTLSNSQLSEISEGKKVNVTGYPGDYAGGTLMCTMEGPIKEWSQTRFFYDIDTTPGQSGSGVWVEEDGEHAVVGVHTYGNDEGKNLNSGTRINDDNGNLIKIWTSGTTN
jgi:V8-like Glu-specific endopeptidase